MDNENNAVTEKEKTRQLEATVTSENEQNAYGPTIIDDSTIPDGGWRAWLVVLGSFCSVMLPFGVLNTGGSIENYLHTERLSNRSESQIGWIFSLYAFLMYFGGIQAGPLFDTFGVRCLIVPGCIGWLAALFILSVCKEYYQFMLGFSLLGGLSASLIFNPGITVIGHWFLKRRGIAMGLAAAGGSVCGIWCSLMLNRLFPRIGYGWTIRVMGFIMLVLAIITCTCCADRRPRSLKVNWKDAMIDVKSFRSKAFTACTAGIFLAEWGYFVPVLYLTSYARQQGLTVDYANALVAYLNVGSTVGRITPGWLADHYGPYNITILMTGLTGIFCLALWIPAGTTKAGITAFAVLFGIFSGSTISLTPVCVATISETSQYGRRYGTAYSVASIAALTGLPIAGALTDHNYLGLIIFSGVSYLASSLAFFAARCWAAGRVLIY